MAIKITTEYKKPQEKQKTYFVIVLDESSSMGAIRDQAIAHFNEQVDEIRKFEEKQDISIIFTKFSSGVEVLKFDEPSSVVTKLTTNDYVPNGMTALFDAVGLTLTRMQLELKDLNKANVAVLFNVITDGHENNSKEFAMHHNGAKRLKQMIKELEGTKKWTFTFSGCGTDFLEQASQLGIQAGNSAMFNATPQGMHGYTVRSVRSTSDYLSSRELGVTSMDNFFTEDRETVAEKTLDKDNSVEDGKPDNQ